MVRKKRHERTKGIIAEPKELIGIVKWKAVKHE